MTSKVARHVGDHHVHSRYSHDAKYDFSQLAQRGAQFGLDWMAFTEHPRMLIFQGLEWYIPAAEHGTVLVAPGPNNVALLQQFEREYDGKLTGRADGNPANEQHAVKALQWLAAQKRLHRHGGRARFAGRRGPGVGRVPRSDQRPAW